MITNKKFKDTRTGEIVEQFNIMDIKYMEELNDELEKEEYTEEEYDEEKYGEDIDMVYERERDNKIIEELEK